MPNKKSKGLTYFFGLIGILFVGVGSWSLFMLINTGAGDLLGWWGVNNVYYQLLIVILVVLAGLFFTGMSVLRAIETLVRR